MQLQIFRYFSCNFFFTSSSLSFNIQKTGYRYDFSVPCGVAVMLNFDCTYVDVKKKREKKTSYNVIKIVESLQAIVAYKIQKEKKITK